MADLTSNFKTAATYSVMNRKTGRVMKRGMTKGDAKIYLDGLNNPMNHKIVGGPQPKTSTRVTGIRKASRRKDGYNIWKQDAKGNLTVMERNMSISRAFDYVSIRRNQLKPGEKILTQEAKSLKVDMEFTRKDSITPKDAYKGPNPDSMQMTKKSPSRSGGSRKSAGGSRRNSSKKANDTYVFYQDASGETLNIIAPNRDSAWRRLEDIAGQYSAPSFELREVQNNAPRTSKKSPSRSGGSRKSAGGSRRNSSKKSKYIPNMFRMTTNRLDKMIASGKLTPKQNRLAKYIVRNRRG